ncbi:hypothetical protein [Capnocytophaga gingivalis]|uniref:hypothetical protein n=1 Tax=Capnocytophaga gingivalis TaxID=1017 RepID=UPI0028E256C0|nr:hypothetical protein [Capnocytophaga gingivalis]
MKVTLRVQGHAPLMEIRNTTTDTIQLFSKLKKESKKASTHILGFKKEGKRYIGGGLDNCYDCFEDYFYLGNTKNNTIKIAPQSSISTYFPYLSSGTYYFEIQTFYIYQKKRYDLKVTPPEININ